MPRGTINLCYPYAYRRAEAIVIGKFASHAPYGEPLKRHPRDAAFCISHVATGRAVCQVRGRKHAAVLTRMLNDSLPGFDIEESDFSEVWSERYRQFVAGAQFTIHHYLKEHPEAKL
jgi:hypothetical protein